MSLVDRNLVAPVGSVGNITSPAFQLPDYRVLALQFVVEAVGATPTVTYKWQGSIDNTNWYDLPYVTDASDTISQATRVVTAVGATVNYADTANGARKFKWVRLVTTANTNVTFRGEAYTVS